MHKFKLGSMHACQFASSIIHVHGFVIKSHACIYMHASINAHDDDDDDEQ